jgi:hypothetical protein
MRVHLTIFTSLPSRGSSRSTSSHSFPLTTLERESLTNRMVKIATTVALLVASVAAESNFTSAAQTIQWSTGSGYASTSVAVGEPVTFVYSTSHDVWKFDDFDAYSKCDYSRATMLADRNGSPFTVNAPAGNSWYGCSVGSHCTSGKQKIELTAN